MSSNLSDLIKDLIETSKQVGILQTSLEMLNIKPSENPYLKPSLEGSLRICKNYIQDLEYKINNNFKPK